MIYNWLEPQPAQLNLTHEEHNENRIDEGTRNLPEQAGAFIWSYPVQDLSVQTRQWLSNVRRTEPNPCGVANRD